MSHPNISLNPDALKRAGYLQRYISEAMRTAHLIVLSLFFTSSAVFAQEGYAHGSDHCYYFKAPSGWIMDNRALASQGVPMVFYPAEATWKSAEFVIYTRPSSQARQAPDPIGAQVREVVSMYKAAAQNVEARKTGTINTQSGAKGELWSFTGYSNGGTELVAYFVGLKTVNYFVAQVPKRADIQQSRRFLIELASSYRESSDCKPCEGSVLCTR
jgi:hypothetical protein